MNRLRQTVEDIELSIRKISEKARKQDTEVIRLDMGEPSFDTPQHVKQAAKQKMEEEQSYAPVSGVDKLREVIAEEESMKDGIDPDTRNVQVTTGGIGAIYSVFSAMLGPEDKAVFNDPCWGPYKLLTQVNGHRHEQVRYFDEDGLRGEAREAIKDAELALINTPSNPLGRMLSKQQAKEIAEFCDDHDTFLLSDEVYHRLNFDREHHSPAAYTENSAIIGSASKNHAMTGWRVGWIVAREEDIHQFVKTNRAITASTPRLSQRAATHALRNDSHVEKMRQEYKERRDLVMQKMDKLGWDYITPHGAIYTFPKVEKDSWKFTLEMVEKGVAMVPGEPFGPRCSQNVRICFGSSTKEELNQAFDILEEHV